MKRLMLSLRRGEQPVKMGGAVEFDEIYLTAGLKGRNNSHRIKRLGRAQRSIRAYSQNARRRRAAQAHRYRGLIVGMSGIKMWAIKKKEFKIFRCFTSPRERLS